MLLTVHTDASISPGNDRVRVAWIVRESGLLLTEGSATVREALPCAGSSTHAELLAVLAGALQVVPIIANHPARHGRGCKVVFFCDSQAAVAGLQGRVKWKDKSLSALRDLVHQHLGNLPVSFRWCDRRSNGRADSLAGGRRAPSPVQREPRRREGPSPLTASIGDLISKARGGS